MNRSPFLVAIFNPINLLMLALVVAAGLLAAWWLAPLGLVLWLVMVILIARDPGLKMTFTRQNRQPLSQRFQARFDHMDRARFSVFNSLASMDAALRRVAEPVSDALDDLVEQTYQLSLRMSSMDNNFAIQKLSGSSDDDISKMQKNISDATDPEARKEYEATLQSLQKSQTQMKAIGTLLSRFEAQLTGTSNAVDGVVTGIVGIQGRNPVQAQDKVTALLATITAEEAELKQFEADLDKSSAV